MSDEPPKPSAAPPFIMRTDDEQVYDEIGRLLTGPPEPIGGHVQSDQVRIMLPSGILTFRAGQRLELGQVVSVGADGNVFTVADGSYPIGVVTAINSDGTANVAVGSRGFWPPGPPPASTDGPITEAHVLEHRECDELCSSAWSWMVGKVPSDAVLRYLEDRPRCRFRYAALRPDRVYRDFRRALDDDADDPHG